MTDYGGFDAKKLPDAIEKAVVFWHEKLALQHWHLNPIEECEENVKDVPFSMAHSDGYRTARLCYSPADRKVWTTVPDDWLARSVGHESAHLMLFPIMDPLRIRLDGPWWEDIVDIDEAVADHIATIVWRLLTPKDRAYLTGLFRAARLTPAERPVPNGSHPKPS